MSKFFYFGRPKIQTIKRMGQCQDFQYLVAMMLFRPAGLLPSRQRKREFAAKDGVAEQEQADLYDARI